MRDYARRGERALTPDSLVAIVFSVAAVEAFTNDLTDHVTVWQTAANDWAPDATTPTLIAAVQGMLAVGKGREREKLMKKYRVALRLLAGKRSHDGHVVQELHRLVHLRDAIVHATARSTESRQKLARAVADLERRRLTVPTNGARANFFLRAQSPLLAKWAYSTARNVILAMLDVAPDVEAVRSLGCALRNRIQFPDVRVPVK
jgi:uncharacterized protein YutE (UPF0331/DUF86 family)